MKRISKNCIIFLLALAVVLETGLLGAVAWRRYIRPHLAAPSQPVEDTQPPAQEAPEQPAESWFTPLPEGKLSAADILAASPVIAHGMGGIGGVTTLNCLEAFEQHYAAGVRVFEVDLRLTYDLQVVLRHDWRAGWQEGISETAVPTLEEFLSKPLLEQYTPLSFRDLLRLMEAYPDICIVTDTKFTDAEVVTVQFEAMLRDAQELELTHLFDRMIVQVYSPLMFKIVHNLHQFPHYIYTLYAVGFGQTEAAFEEIAAFCRDSGIGGVTMWDSWWSAAYAPIAREYGIYVCTHTVNDPAWANTMLSEGVKAVYTDTLIPDDFS